MPPRNSRKELLLKLASRPLVKFANRPLLKFAGLRAGFSNAAIFASALVASCLALFLSLLLTPSSNAQFKSRYANLPSATGFGSSIQQRNYATQPQTRTAPQQQRGGKSGGSNKSSQLPVGRGVYPEFRSQFGVIHWISDQMPLKVWVSNGEAIDSILDPQLGAPYVNVDSVSTWPDLVADIVVNRDKLAGLPAGQGYLPEHRQATIEGINYWKPFEHEGLFSYQLTDDPSEADIHVFFVHHFVNKLGLALFANDIRGYTAKRSFPYRAILEGKKADFKPVVIILRTTEKDGQPMPLAKMRAAAGHEFGHALGIEGHSTNPGDLMSLYYGNGRLSPSDIATIRYLYKIAPDLIP